MELRTRGNARAWHLLTFVVAAFAVVLQLVLIIKGQQHLGQDDPEGPELGTRLSHFVSYLTIWSNVLGTVIAASLAIDPERDGRVWRVLRLNAVVILVGGGVVHWFLLRPILDLHGANALADKLLHIVVPLLMLAGWLVFGPRDRVGAAELRAFLILPAVWLAYTLVRGAFVHWYPYPFVNVDGHGYPFVLGAGIAVGAMMLALAAGCWWLDRRLPRQAHSKATAGEL